MIPLGCPLGRRQLALSTQQVNPWFSTGRRHPRKHRGTISARSPRSRHRCIRSISLCFARCRRYHAWAKQQLSHQFHAGGRQTPWSTRFSKRECSLLLAEQPGSRAHHPGQLRTVDQPAARPSIRRSSSVNSRSTERGLTSSNSATMLLVSAALSWRLPLTASKLALTT